MRLAKEPNMPATRYAKSARSIQACWIAYRSRRLAAPGELAIQQAWIERALLAYLVAGMFGSYAKLTFPYLLLAVLWCSATLLASPSLRANGAARTTRA